MALIQFLTSIALITTFFFGQLFRFNFQNISIPVIDIFIVFYFLFNIFDHLYHHQLKAKNKFLLYFLIFAWISFIINSIFFGYPILKPILYLIRLSFLISLFIYPPKSTRYTRYIKGFFILSIIANIIFGLIQYTFWPDFTSFGAINWDPHLYRLVSTFFDPTFTGLIYLFFLIFLFFQKKYYFLFFPYLALSLTYSRSSLLSLFIVSLFIGFKVKNKLIPIITGIIILATVFILPRQAGEGTKLERDSSIKAKIENYQEGFSTFISSPIIGHGYNNLSYVRQINIPDSHSNSGFDGSLLTILTTTGLIGFGLFCIAAINLFRNSSLFYKSLLLALFVHSLFANSLLYPWTLLFLVLI